MRAQRVGVVRESHRFVRRRSRSLAVALGGRRKGVRILGVAVSPGARAFVFPTRVTGGVCHEAPSPIGPSLVAIHGRTTELGLGAAATIGWAGPVLFADTRCEVDLGRGCGAHDPVVAVARIVVVHNIEGVVGVKGILINIARFDC